MYFSFEEDFIDSMRCIPMAVRCKLDTCGIKLKLAEWSKFTKAERDQLAMLPCETTSTIQAYRIFLQQLVQQYTQTLPDELPTEDQPAWLNDTEIPQLLQEKAQALDIAISLLQWQQLHPLQRFALIKLSRPSHESKNFPRALQEFGFTSTV